MLSHLKNCWPSLFLVTVFLEIAGPLAAHAADSPSGVPVTVAEAAKVIDLATLPLMAGAEPPHHRNLAGLSYTAPGTVNSVFEFHRKQLLDKGWKELPGGYTSDQATSGTFARDGFSLSMSVYPGSKTGAVSVTLTNHGNVELAKLPVPSGVKPFFGGPVSTSYITETSVEQTADACRKLLLAEGWQPYGTAGDVLFFKQNAVRLSARISAAPAQGGKTVIDYSTALVSVDLPAPAETVSLQYTDVNTQLFFDSKASEQDIVGFYRPTLAKAGWEATTEKPIKIGFKDMLIFRNPQKDMLTLEMYDVDGKTRVLLKHQSAAEVAELDEQVKAEAERRKAEKNKPLPKLMVTLPPDATDIKQTKNRIEFQLAAGKAKAAVEGWRKQFAKDGWKEEVAASGDMAGSISFNKESQSLSVIYSDTGFLPAEITIHATGVELERAVETK
jgi:hypothetical protein